MYTLWQTINYVKLPLSAKKCNLAHVGNLRVASNYVYIGTQEAHDHMTSFFVKWRENFMKGNQTANHSIS